MKQLKLLSLLVLTFFSSYSYSGIIFETTTAGGFTTSRTSNAYVTWLRSDTTKVISSFSLYGNATQATDLQFLIFKLDGTRLLNFSSNTTSTNGLDWINSGDINFTLEAGVEYGFGAQSVNSIGWYADQTGVVNNGFESFTHTNSNAYGAFGNAALSVNNYNCCDAGIRLYGQSVPEPSILALISLGVLGLGLSRRKMKK